MAVFDAIVSAVAIGVIVAAFLYSRGEYRSNTAIANQFKASGGVKPPASAPAAVPGQKTQP